jgi:hypothetical protein
MSFRATNQLAKKSRSLCAGDAFFPTRFAGCPRLTGNGDSKRRYTMGDKGKKDKEKSRKQKIVKQTQQAKKAQDKFEIKFPLTNP